ncbi:MAG: hypothetical protein J0M30_14840 [Chitinophagales bacterium]|nr:hypothetical protein [Chitinophagales bacterium]
MALAVVQGKNAIMRLKYGGEFKLVACVDRVKLFVETPLDPTSTPSSGLYQTKWPSGVSDWSVEMSGVTILQDEVDDRLTSLDLIREQVRQFGLDMKLVLVDDNAVTAFIYGHVFPSPTEMDFEVGNIGKFLTTLQGSGTLTINDQNIDINSTEVNPFDYQATGLEGGVITHATLTNVNIIWCDRSDFFWRVFPDTDFDPDPDNRTAIHDRAAGSVDFGQPLGAGERIAFLYKPL